MKYVNRSDALRGCGRLDVIDREGLEAGEAEISCQRTVGFNGGPGYSHSSQTAG